MNGKNWYEKGWDDLEEEESKRFDKNVEIVLLIRDLYKSCESLMSEVYNHGVTDWGLVNETLVKAKRFLGKAKGREGK